MQKPSMIILLIISFSGLTIGCAEKADGEAKGRESSPVAVREWWLDEEEPKPNEELAYSGVKVPLMHEGKHLSYGFRENQYPYLDSVNSFLNWYSDTELFYVQTLIIRNRNTSTGEIVPLVTTKGIERLPNLRHLKITTSGIERLEGHEQLKYIERIELQNNGITSVDNISHLDSLRSLTLSGNPIASVWDIDSSEYLISLNVDGTRLTNLDGIERFPNLVGFDASDNRLENITAIQHLQHLRSAGIFSRNNNLNEDSIKLLQQMEVENPAVNIMWEL